MKKIIKQINILIISILLFIIAYSYIAVVGNIYEYKIDISDYKINNVDEINLLFDNGEEVVKCTDKRIEDGYLVLKFESVSRGKTYIDVVHGEDYVKMITLYVHSFGVITEGSFFGNCTGGKAVPVAMVLIIIYVIVVLASEYRKKLKDDMYQYVNIFYLGLLIFFVFALINQTFTVFRNNYGGVIQTIEEIVRICSYFSLFVFPFGIITSVLLVLSNIYLIKHEGLHLRNILGIGIAIFFILATLLPGILNDALQRATWIDVHNDKGLAKYVLILFEVSVYIIISYLECVLFATIILGVKSAKNIPEFDKDYIVILGCKIKKDGSLTNLLKGRTDRAIEFSKMQKEATGKKIVFVPSGGQGSDEVIPEAEAMKNYLVAEGIDEKDILVENKSKNTYENIEYSNNIIKEKNQNAKVAFSTTNYHVFRAGSIASRQNVHMEGVGAKTKSYFWINAFIREYLATLFSEKKQHIGVVLVMILTAIHLVVLLYLANVI